MSDYRPKAVAVVSGGLDSTVLAYHLVAQGFNLHLLSFDYGQRHSRELEFAAATAKKLLATHEVVDLRAITKLISDSVLTDHTREVPEGHYAADNMMQTVVPNRNQIMLSIAYGYAVSIGAEQVVTGVHAGDHFVYPDCRPEFIKAQALASYLGNMGFGNPNLVLVAPFVEMTKTQIVRMGSRLSVPFENTWSCYNGGEVHCSKCGTCAERREAFIEAGVEDPTEYAISRSEFDIWWARQKQEAHG